MSFYGCDSARVFHVSKAGNDSNGGRAQQYPVSLASDSKLTINSAISAASDGDTIVIWPGTYNEIVDIKTAAKSLHLTGYSPFGREKCIIAPSTGKGILTYHNCVIENLKIATADNMGIDCVNQHDCKFINLHITSNGIDGLYASGSRDTVIDNCFVFCKYDVVYLGENGVIRNSILVSDATYPSASVARVLTTSGSGGYSNNFLVENSILIVQPSWRKGSTLYESNVSNCYDISGSVGNDHIVLSNCILVADGYKPPFSHTNSYAAGNFHIADVVSQLNMINCFMFVRTDQNRGTTIGYGLRSSDANLENCRLNISGTSAAYDFYTTGANTIYLANTKYNPNQIGTNITVKAVPAGMTFEKAAKLLVNKAVQDKITGAIDYYDDDGQTILFTHTPIDDESTITRTPS